MSQPPELVDDLVKEFLLRCPPDDPACLLRAALVCKRWYRLISGRRFRRRFAELHRTAPMLGFFYCRLAPLRFVPTTSFRPPPSDSLRISRALDARHGRVLLHNLFSCQLEETKLIVWDPITGGMRPLPMPRFRRSYTIWTAAVLCLEAGCDHLDCGGGRFLVVFVATDESERFTSTCIYSSENGAWSKLTTAVHAGDRIDLMPNVLVGNTLYFLFERGIGILKHDLSTREVSVINLPPASYSGRVLPTSEGVIDLEDALSVRALEASPQVVGFADGIGIILVRMVDAFFTVDVKSNLVKKIAEGLDFFNVVPYLSFYTPALGAASSDGGPRATAPHSGGACRKASRARLRRHGDLGTRPIGLLPLSPLGQADALMSDGPICRFVADLLGQMVSVCGDAAAFWA
ncbi:hypothetical protein QOZ80_2AG0113550 [Eleusine coracana subsp. coracana]|nr:hypothetical protein QOZ80_2AG0113550 [Eleusine coracana subsp. coracana]